MADDLDQPDTEMQVQPENEPSDPVPSIPELPADQADTGNANTNVSVSEWAEETALSFINLADVVDGNVRREAFKNLKEDDIVILIKIAQSYVNLQNFYSIEKNDENVANSAKKNQDKITFLKSWMGI